MTNLDQGGTAPAKYHSVNSKWPDVMPTLEGGEAIAAAKRLYRFAMKKSFRGKFKLASGNRFTWIRNGVFYVNPARTGHGTTGWHDLVHMISHLCHRRLYPTKRPHDSRHEYLERDMIQYILAQGWLDGRLRKAPKERPDVKEVRHARVIASIERWERKAKRANTALQKLRKAKARYEKMK